MRHLFLIALFAATMISFAGCGKEATEPAATETSETASEDPYAEELAKLPEADQALAASQKICPVSGEPLGSMGVPVKVELEDTSVLVCCEHCIDSVKSDPEKFLAKLKQ